MAVGEKTDITSARSQLFIVGKRETEMQNTIRGMSFPNDVHLLLEVKHLCVIILQLCGEPVRNKCTSVGK